MPDLKLTDLRPGRGYLRTAPLFFVFLILSVGVPIVQAAQSATGVSPIEALIAETRDRGLAHDPYWLALGHYRGRGDGKGGRYRSEISAPEFFLAADGRSNPAAELEASLRAFTRPPTADPDAHPGCQYVARRHWLTQQLPGAANVFTPMDCPAFQQWSLGGRVESVSLVFAAGYFSNPASFYGHMVVKLNAPRDLVGTQLLDQSLNYGAIVPDGENPVVYILRGVFGGYEAAYSDQRFYRHTHAYGEEELRDLWEYELNLSPEEVAQVTRHAWELLGARFTYYFFDRNCAYHVARFLELTVDEPLLPHALPYAIPGVVFQRVAAVERNGKPLVRAIRLIPSRQRRFAAHYAALSPEGREQAVAIAEGDALLTKESLAGLPEYEQVRVLDTLIDYYEYRRIRAAEDADPELTERKRAVQLARLRLPAAADVPPEPSTLPPHRGPFPATLRVGTFYNEDLGAGLSLRLRPAYYDALVPVTSQRTDAQLTMADLQLDYIEGDGLRLRRFDLFDVCTLNLPTTPLPGDGGWAWRLRLGTEVQDLACDDCQVAHLTGAFGKAGRLGPAVTLGAFVEGRLQSEEAESGLVAVAPWASLGLRLGKGYAASLEGGYRVFPDGERNADRILRFEQRFGASAHWDVRLSYEYHRAEQGELAVSFYF